ncbi:MAG: hypothetical protein JWL58_7350, partial [Streptosporangiaceae bacterium]|nr:hypothetical protein [Streptosporangiaceae bacterium]
MLYPLSYGRLSPFLTCTSWRRSAGR